MTRQAIWIIGVSLLAMPSLVLGRGNIGGDGPMVVAGAESMAGPDSASLTGSWKFGAGVKMRKGSNVFKLNLGAMLSFSPGSVSIANTKYPMTAFAGELLAGIAFIPIAKGPVLPILEANLLVGGKLLRIDLPPAGTDSGTLGLTYGAQLLFAAQFRLAAQPWQVGVAYTIRQASQLANISPFNLNSLGVEMGWMF